MSFITLHYSCHHNFSLELLPFRLSGIIIIEKYIKNIHIILYARLMYIYFLISHYCAGNNPLKLCLKTHHKNNGKWEVFVT